MPPILPALAQRRGDTNNGTLHGLPWYRRAGRRVLGAVIGHGYRPWLAGIWAVGIVAAFALVVWHWSAMFAPEKQSVTGSPQPIAYSADTLLPIVDLGQADSWMPTEGYVGSSGA